MFYNTKYNFIEKIAHFSTFFFSSYFWLAWLVIKHPCKNSRAIFLPIFEFEIQIMKQKKMLWTFIQRFYQKNHKTMTLGSIFCGKFYLSWKLRDICWWKQKHNKVSVTKVFPSLIFLKNKIFLSQYLFLNSIHDDMYLK